MLTKRNGDIMYQKKVESPAPQERHAAMTDYLKTKNPSTPFLKVSMTIVHCNNVLTHIESQRGKMRHFYVCVACLLS